MCYTFEVSATSFAINIVGCAVLFMYSPPVAVFFFFVGLMQLYDAIFWKNQSENGTNWVTTKIAMVSNHLQPIVLAACITLLSRQRLRPVSLGMTVAYAIVALVYTAYSWNKVTYTLVRPVSAPSLSWDWNRVQGAYIMYSLFVATMLVVAYENLKAPLNYAAVAFLVASLLLGQPYMKQVSLGRFWCFFASYIPIVLVAILVVTGYRL
jgi:hypothetical protein